MEYTLPGQDHLLLDRAAMVTNSCQKRIANEVFIRYGFATLKYCTPDHQQANICGSIDILQANITTAHQLFSGLLHHYLQTG